MSKYPGKHSSSKKLEPSLLTLLSYNLESPSHYDSNTSRQCINAVIGNILQYRPDIVFLQHVSASYMKALQTSELEKHYFIPRGLKHNPANVILTAGHCEMTRLSEKRFVVKHNVQEDDVNTSTSLTVATVKVPHGNKYINVCVASVTLQNGQDLWRRRKKNWEDILEYLSKRTYCIMGVTTYTTDQGRDIIRVPADWRDMWIKMRKPNKLCYTYDGSKNKNVPHRKMRYRYDRILMKTPHVVQVKQFKLIGTNAINGKDLFASLHFGVLTEIRHDTRKRREYDEDDSESHGNETTTSSESSGEDNHRRARYQRQRQRHRDRKYNRRSKKRKKRRMDIDSSSLSTSSSSSFYSGDATRSSQDNSYSYSDNEMVAKRKRQRRHGHVGDLEESDFDPKHRRGSKRFGHRERNLAKRGFIFNNRRFGLPPRGYQRSKSYGNDDESYSRSSESASYSDSEGVMDRRIIRRRAKRRRDLDKELKRKYNKKELYNKRLSRKERQKLFRRGKLDRRGELHLGRFPSLRKQYRQKYYERKETDHENRGSRRRRKRIRRMDEHQAGKYAFQDDSDDSGDEKRFRSVRTDRQIHDLARQREEDEKDIRRELINIHGRSFRPERPPPLPSERRRPIPYRRGAAPPPGSRRYPSMRRRRY